MTTIPLVVCCHKDFPGGVARKNQIAGVSL